MEKTIWVIGNNKAEMLDAQRAINSDGSMRAVCILSGKALERAGNDPTAVSEVSLIILDLEMSMEENFESLGVIMSKPALAGVPLFFMTNVRSPELDEACYERGAIVVLTKPFTKSGIVRAERTAWQYEVSKNVEKVLQRQASDLLAAKEINRLNEKLKARNELLSSIFGRYFSDKVLEVILENPSAAAVGGERREVTVMMTDLRGFTSVSEMLDSDSMTEMLNFYFARMSEVVKEYHGTIIEFLGDSVLAVFGAPLSNPNHTEEAIAAAIKMQNVMSEVDRFCEEKGYPLLEMGIGLHRGEAFIGNIGSEKMMRYNVVGRTVNICSRIENVCVGGQILISEEALNKVSCRVDVINRNEINAKGVPTPIKICEITGIEGDYNMRMENVRFDIMVPVDEGIVFNLYIVDGKHIREIPCSAGLKEFSHKRAYVRLFEDTTDIAVNTDVEIFAAWNDGTAAFVGVYAKVTQKDDRFATLHFTHVNHSFELFADDLLYAGK